jgi:hypothetical protein
LILSPRRRTIFRSVYERCNDILHHEGAFLVEGRVEQTIETRIIHERLRKRPKAQNW